MVSFSAYMTGFFMNFELLPILTQWTIKISSPLFSVLSLVAILVGSRDQRTHVTKNRNFFKWPKLLYFKPECAQI
jgi:hypothetical protein